MGSAYPTGAIVVPFGTNGTQPLPFKRRDRVASGSSREPQAVSLRLPGEAAALRACERPTCSCGASRTASYFTWKPPPKGFWGMDPVSVRACAAVAGMAAPTRYRPRVPGVNFQL